MKFTHLKVLNIRNHKRTAIDFKSGINILWGDNGAGKTSILESLAICGFTKSFVNSKDINLINNSAKNYFVEAKLINDNKIPYKIKVFYEPNKKKVINSSLGDNLLPKDIIGQIPMIILAPDMKNVTNGAPEYRRQFIDKILSQESYDYFENLMKYKRTLKQRNSLLYQYKTSKIFDSKQFQSWTKILINIAIKIFEKRAKFIDNFNSYFQSTYKNISNADETVELIYKPDSINNFEGNLFEHLSDISEQLADEEFSRATTLFGPHKDDMLIVLNGKSAKEVASQGQHKSLLIALKFAEFQYLKNNKKETPIVILDDIFSELDENRISRVFDLTCQYDAQTFISTTEPERINKLLKNGTEITYYQLKNGEIID